MRISFCPLVTETYFETWFRQVSLSGVLLARKRKVNQDNRLIRSTNFTADGLKTQTKLCSKK